MLDALGPLVNRVSEIAAAVRGAPHFEWGTVITSSPLTVQLDGDTDPLLGTPSKLTPGLIAGERVLVLLQNRLATVIGRGETTEWVPITPGPGWTAVAGHTPRCRIANGVLWLEGAFSRGEGGALDYIGTIPPGILLQGGKTVFVGGLTARKTDGARAHAELYISFSSRKLQVADYTTIDNLAGWVVPISGSLLANQA